MSELSAERTGSSIIMVAGIGGAGGNAVNHMWNLGIRGVDFMVCNTDQQALDKSPVVTKVRLGAEGLGAGNDPENGRKAAVESLPEIRQRLEASGTRMIFITAGMGGGTGTGASPVIAKLAREMGLLTVAIVTSPLAVEGRIRYEQAFRGIEELRQNVDSLLVINNENILEMYGRLALKQAFGKADDILAAAAKGIAELITVESDLVNVDFADVAKVMHDSGRAHMGVASAEGEGRALEAARRSLCSPLLDSNLISGAKNILINISAADIETVSYDETMEILNYIQSYASYKDEDGVEHRANLIWGASSKTMADNVLEVVVVATGFDDDDPIVRPVSPFAQPVPVDIEPLDDEEDEIEIIGGGMIPPAGVSQGAAPQARHASSPAVLDRKPSKYNNIEVDIRTPAFKRRNVMFVIEQNDGVARRKEVLREEQAEGTAEPKKGYDNHLF